HHPYNQNLGTAYDPENTYRITPNLLRQIQSLSTIAQSEIPRRFNVEFNNNILNDLERIWRGPVCSNGLSLLIAIVLYFRRESCRPRRLGAVETQSGMEDGNSKSIKLEVKTIQEGKAKIIWSGIPKRLLDQGVMVVLYENNGSESKLDSVRIHKKSPYFFTRFFRRPTIVYEICRSPEFHNANGEIPVDLSGYRPNSSLQLFVKDGKACARLFVKNMIMAPGVLARFMLQRRSSEVARTVPWERVVL
ncbi:unnamed protein product, partial [Coregonus sp. 'balchen']